MSAPDYLAGPDRNFVTCGEPEPHQRLEAAQARYRALGLLDERIKRLPFEVEPLQLLAARAILARAPLAVDRALRLVRCPPAAARLRGRHHGVPRLPCRLRACAFCAERRALRLARVLGGRAAKYAAPLSVLLTAPSRTMLDLPVAMQNLRNSLAKLRRRRMFATAVPAGTFVLEAPLTRDHRRWNVHAHGIVNAIGDSPQFRKSCLEQWIALVGVPGAFISFEPLRDPYALFRYALKVGREKSTAPDAGTLSPTQMAHLDLALRGKRLHISWGPKAAGSPSVPVSPESCARARARGQHG